MTSLTPPPPLPFPPPQCCRASPPGLTYWVPPCAGWQAPPRQQLRVAHATGREERMAGSYMHAAAAADAAAPARRHAHTAAPGTDVWHARRPPLLPRAHGHEVLVA
jgi:hypothetical protein